MAREPVTGSVVEIARGRVRATVDPVGAGLHSLEVSGVPVVESYERHAPLGGAPAASGATLFPWPNRVRDARWTWKGAHHQLAVTEPARHTANHGLVRTRSFDVSARTDNSVTLGTTVTGEAGYPFTVLFTVNYTILDAGVSVRYDATNLGDSDAPIAVGAHPYLRAGDTDTDDVILDVHAGTVLELDDRLLPVAERRVAASVDDPSDLHVSGRHLNSCYGDLRPVPGGGFLHRLRAPGGHTVELRTDEKFRWLQVYTSDDFVRDGRLVRAIALEPMTAPPDALNSATDLAVVKPGASWSAEWSLTARANG
jgi:aldose 1-epimerase